MNLDENATQMLRMIFHNIFKMGNIMHHSNRSFLSKHYEHGSHKDKPMESSEMWDFLLHSFFVPNIQQFIEQTALR